MKPLFRRCVPLWLFTAVALVVYNAVLGVQVLRDHQAVVEAATLKAANIGRVQSEEFANYLTFVGATLETIDFLAEILPPLEENDTSVTTLQSLIAAKTKQLALIRSLLVVGPDGYMIIDERGRPAAPLDLSDRDYFKAHIEPHSSGVFVGEPVVGRTSGKWFLGVSKRWESTKGTFNGVMAAIVEPVFLGRTLTTSDLGQRGVAALLTNTGTIIARSSGQDVLVGRKADDDKELGIAASSLSTVLTPDNGPDNGSVQPARIVVTMPVTGFPVTVAVSLDRDEILAPWRANLAYYGLAMLLPSLAGVAATMLAGRQRRALEVSEASLQVKVAELRESRRKLEEQNAALAALAEQRAAAQADAEASSMAKSIFLASVSHELRTPLNAIIGFAELIQESPSGPAGHPEHADFADFAGNIHTSGIHLLDLINNILDFSRIETKDGSLIMEPVSVEAITRFCIGRVHQRAVDAGIAVENRIAGSAVVMADERALRQVLINLLTNAIKFTPFGGTVTMDATTTQGRLKVTIADTGIGIRKQDLPKLGQPFEQANNQLHDKPAGTGLGLALSRRLVELHGGTLTIESEVGVGTTVTFTLPLDLDGMVSNEAEEAVAV
jgi:signal transduction histidine kinase